MKPTQPTVIPTDVISLIRVSTAEQAQGDKAGVARQRTANIETAQRNGLRIRREVVAIDVSGRHVLQDAQFQGIFQELNDPALAGVLVAEQSRLIRPEQYGDVAIFDLFAQNRKLIYTPSEVVDPNTSAGRMSLGMRAMMSREELILIRERMMGGKRDKRENGQCPNGNQTLPRTVRYVREFKIDERTGERLHKVIGWKWEQVPIEAARIKRAFDLLIAGDSYELICEKIGGGWTGTGLRLCLQNPIHIGIRRYFYKAGEEYLPKPSKKNPNPTKKKRHSVKLEVPYDVPTREELEAGAKPIVEPLVSREIFDRAQAIIASRLVRWRRSKEKHTTRERFLGLGIVQCSCLKRLYPRYGGRGVHLDRYYCSSQLKGSTCACSLPTIRRMDLDHALEDLISKLATDEFVLQAVKLVLADEEAKPDSVEQLRYREALAKMESGKKELLKLVTKGVISADDYKAQMLENEQEVKALRSLVPVERPRLPAKEIARIIISVFAGFRHLSFANKRTLLRGAIGGVTVDGRGKALVTVTVNGGYLGYGVKLQGHSRLSTGIDSIPDLTFTLPHPVVITQTYETGRNEKGYLLPGNTIRADALARELNQ